MHFGFITTTATLLAVAATSCAAGPMPPPRRLADMTPSEELSYYENGNCGCEKSLPPRAKVSPPGNHEHPGADASKILDMKPDSQPPNPPETQEASMRRRGEAIPPPHLALKELKDYHEGIPLSKIPLLRGDDSAQPPSEEREMRRETAGPLSPPHLTPEEIEKYAKMTHPLPDEDVPQCKQPGISREDREKITRARELLEEKRRGHGGRKPDGDVLKPLPPV
jgi:hypothetical protein